MADYSMYHALGQGDHFDPNDPNRTSQPAPPQFQPPVAPQPYQQAGGYAAAAPAPSPGSRQPSWSASPAAGGPAPPPGPGYGPGQAPSPAPDAGALAAQMGDMSLAPDGSRHGTARRKKKDRHAYHAVEAPTGSSQAFNGMPTPDANQSAFFSTDPHLAGIPSGVPSSQFPVPVNPQFSPSPASPAEFGARPAAAADPGSSIFNSGSVSGPGPTHVSADDTPSVPLSRDSVQQYFFNNVYPTLERHVPPPATVSFVALDQGNASPKFARLTMNNIPAGADALNAVGIPLGLVLQPLARLQPGELETPVLDFGNDGPPRCHRCRAYINPFMMFRSGGNKFVCNLCTYPNDTPPEYFCATSPQGLRADRDQRPELCRGTVEFAVPKEYWNCEPAPLRLLFLIDVTQESYKKGFVESFCDGILAALYGGVDDDDDDGDDDVKRKLPPGAKVGFVTFDKEIHFYNVSPALEQAQMIIMPDIEDPFVPLGDGLFVDPYEARTVVTSLLTRIPSIFSTVKNPEPALLSALTSALAALEKTGGKILCSLAALPTWGPGRLFLRDDGRHAPGGEPDKKLLTTEHPAWRKLAERMAAAGVGADLFMAAPSGGYLDMATVGHVPATTGGEAFYYPNFVAPRDNARLSLEVRHAVTRETGCQALVKVRCSNGLQVAAYHGSFVQRGGSGAADLELGVIDADKAFGVTFSHDGRLDPKLDAHFQSALLYTTASGERRVRCHNVIASVCESPRDCIKFVDQDAVCTLLAKEAATRLSSTASSLRDVRLGISERVIDVLAAYRRNLAAHSHPASQLVMPDRLKELSMYMLGLVKSRAFKAGLESSDRRAHELRLVRAAGAAELSLYMYPRVIPLHNLQPEEGFPDPATGHLRLPPAARASFSRVEPGGVYLVDNGQQCLIWLHAQTSPNLVADLFGPDKTSLQDLDAYASSLPVLQTHLNAQVRNVLEFLRSARGSKALVLQLARQGIDGAEYEFARMLVEDRNNEAQSYVDWLVHLHKAVQLELAGQRKREDAGDGPSLTNFAGLRSAYW